MEVVQKAGARAQVVQRDGQESLGPGTGREAEARPTGLMQPSESSPGGLEGDIRVLPLSTLISLSHLCFGCEGLSQGLVHIVPSTLPLSCTPSLLCPFIG